MPCVRAVFLGGCLFALLMISVLPTWANEPSHLTPEGIIQQQMDRLPTDDLDEFMRTMDYDIRELLPPFDLKALIFDGENIRWSEMGRRLLYTLTSEIAINLTLLGQLIIIGVFCALLKNVAGSFGGSEASEVAFFLCLLLLMLVSLQALRSAVALASETIGQMVDFMVAILPVFSTLLAAAGAVTTAAIFHPLLYATVTTIAMVMRSVLFPLVLVMAGLSVLGSLSKDFPLKQFSGLLRTGATMVLGISFLVFFTVIKARGAIAPVADGFALRTAKFLTGSFVPVIGGRLADALDVVIGGSVLIKNAVGLFGMGVIAVLTAFPLMKIFAILIMFRVATALIEPITDPRLVQAMTGLANSLTLILAGVITAALMFFVAITIVVSVGNTAAAMR